MKILVDINEEKLVKGDLLMWNGKEFVGYDKERIVKEYELAVRGFEIELAQFKKAVNDKLKEQHELLQVLYKTEE